MAKIAGKELRHFSGMDAVEERKEILNNLNLAITDMGLKVSRSRDSSLDEHLYAIEYMDILDILDLNTGINKIIFTTAVVKSVQHAGSWST